MIEKKSNNKNIYNNDYEYEVEKILSRRFNNNNIEYRVKWRGYHISESTWEPLENLKNCIILVQQFEKNLRNEKKLLNSGEKEINNDNINDQNQQEKELTNKKNNNSEENNKKVFDICKPENINKKNIIFKTFLNKKREKLFTQLDLKGNKNIIKGKNYYLLNNSNNNLIKKFIEESTQTDEQNDFQDNSNESTNNSKNYEDEEEIENEEEMIDKSKLPKAISFKYLDKLTFEQLKNKKLIALNKLIYYKGDIYGLLYYLENKNDDISLAKQCSTLIKNLKKLCPYLLIDEYEKHITII